MSTRKPAVWSGSLRNAVLAPMPSMTERAKTLVRSWVASTSRPARSERMLFTASTSSLTCFTISASARESMLLEISPLVERRRLSACDSRRE